MRFLLKNLLYSSRSSEKLIVIMFIATQPSKPHILRFTIAVNENKMLTWWSCLFFKLVNKYSQTTTLISLRNLTYPTHWMPSSLVTAFLPKCLSPSFSRRRFTWLHKFWRKGRSTCGLATFGVSLTCSCICKDLMTLKSFLRSTVFCWVVSPSESKVFPLSGTCVFRSWLIFTSSHIVSLVNCFLTGKGSLTDWSSNVWIAALRNPSIAWSPPKSEFFPKIQLSLSPRGRLFWWKEKQYN